MKFLHLSDLHFRNDWPEEILPVKNAFWQDLGEVLDDSSDDNYLIFSGDLVQSGSSPTLYNDFAKEFGEKLNKVGIPKSRRICVPGNHDISRDAIEHVHVHLGAIKNLCNESEFVDSISSSHELLFTPKFSNYKNCEQDFCDKGALTGGLGGTGWDINDEIGVYCLNTALCSFGGLKNDRSDDPINDRGILGIDTRSLHLWLEENTSCLRILVMHHPTNWLTQWAQEEIQQIIREHFDLVFFGHEHVAQHTRFEQFHNSTIHVMAPPLFTRKAESLGYAIIDMPHEENIRINYREWAPNVRKFVTGSRLSGSNEGIVSLQLKSKVSVQTIANQKTKNDEVRNVLEAELNTSLLNCSFDEIKWTDRELSTTPENGTKTAEQGDYCTEEMLSSDLRNLIIRAPSQFGLTCLGRKLALDAYILKTDPEIWVYIDISDIKPKEKIIDSLLAEKCAKLSIGEESITGLILDGWQDHHLKTRVLTLFQNRLDVPIVLLEGYDDFLALASGAPTDIFEVFDVLYLNSLSRHHARQLIGSILQNSSSELEENSVLTKVLSDIDSLCMHRTPTNVIMLTKLAISAFDDSPVNRTEVIGNVLFVLFYEFDRIPKYSERPDLKDCNVVLGCLCEWLLKNDKKSFSKPEFIEVITTYCGEQLMDLDVEILFNFLYDASIIISRNGSFSFRQKYWFYYFCAQRMHHSEDFSEYILSKRRYAAFPEVVEFYTGIDRKRDDAVSVLAEDLRLMDADFISRTKISPDFNPFDSILWDPKPKSIEETRNVVIDNASHSSLPNKVKDAIADKSFDRAAPYYQEISDFIEESSLPQMVQAMQGAARALRNSDYVNPRQKLELLERVITCWVRIAQLLGLLSPILAKRHKAFYEGIGFVLDESFLEHKSEEDLLLAVISSILDNVVGWHDEDLFSRKLGPLYSKYLSDNKNSLSGALMALFLVRHRPTGWAETVNSYILGEKKNSHYLGRLFQNILHEYQFAFVNEKTRHELRNLWATAAAKHLKGVKKPNQKTKRKVVSEVEKSMEDS